MKKLFFVTLSLIFVSIIVLFQLKTESIASAQSGLKIYLPIAVKPPEIPMSIVYVDNDTGGELCYEVLDTGFGRQCFSDGLHFYGSFPSGSYRYKAEARCGTLDNSRTYTEGFFAHYFFCISSDAPRRSEGLRTP